MSQLYKRLLILAVLVCSLAWVAQNADAQFTDPCSQCTSTYFNCLDGCEQARQECIALGGFDCGFSASICSSNCDGSYTSCRNQSCGGGGGGGVSCSGNGFGYSRACAELERGNRDHCIANGSSGSTYQTCMSNFNDPAYCCDQQINADIQANCQCMLDTRNPDCVCNP